MKHANFLLKYNNSITFKQLTISTLFSVAMLHLTGCNPSTQSTENQNITNTHTETIIPSTEQTHINAYRAQYVEQMLLMNERLQQDSQQQNVQPKDNETESTQTASNQPLNTNNNQVNTLINDVNRVVSSDSAIDSADDTSVDVTEIHDAEITQKTTTADDNKQDVADAERKKQQALARQQLIKRFENNYDNAMQGLFTEHSLNAEQMNTFINMVTILPEVLDNDGILTQLKQDNKSPALARLIDQHRIWEEIQEKQRLEVQKLQQQRIEDNEKRQQELDTIAKKFQEKIDKYDQKIAQYDKLVKSTR